MTTVSDPDAELLRLMNRLLSADFGRTPATATATATTRATRPTRFRTRNEIATTNAILEIVRGYTSSIQQYNRNMDRVLRMLESELYDQRNTARTGVEEPELPTRSSSAENRPTSQRGLNADFSFWLNPFSLYRRTADTAGLTPAQIDSVVCQRTYRVSEFPENRVCPISLDDFAEGESILELRECRHVFKPAELRRWLERHDCCPVCRRNVHPAIQRNANSTPNPNPNVEEEEGEGDDVPPPLLEPETSHESVRDEPVQRRNPHSGFEYSYVIEYPVWINDLSGSRFS